MPLQPIDKLKEQAARQRARLLSGEKPKPWLESRLQATAIRLLCAFFALMLALTLLSRAADGVTVPRVTVEGTKSGVLTSRITGPGSIEPLGDLSLTLPGGLLISGVTAEKGQRVAAGDTLLELDLDGLRDQITTLEEKLRILDLRLAAAAGGAVSADTDAVLEAQRVLAEKEADLLRLEEKLARTDLRGTEDLTQAEADLVRAQADYDTAVEQAEKALVKAADQAIREAEEHLATVKEAADDAIASAQAALESAEDAQNAESDREWSAAQAVNRAQSQRNQAQADLDALLADPAADPEAVQAARDRVASAQSALDSAQAALDGMSTSGGTSSAVRRAREALKRAKERGAEKVKEAERKLEETRTEQAAKKRALDVSGDPSVLSAQAALESADKAVKTQLRTNEDGGLTAQEQLLAARRAAEEAARGVEAAQRKVQETARTDESTRRQAEIERLGYLSERRTLQQSLEDLRAIRDAGGRLTAPVAGVVQSIPESAGKTQDGVPSAVLARGDQGFTFSCKVPQEDAAKLAQGDEGTVTYTHQGERRSVKVAVASVGAADDKGQVTVTAQLPEGAYPVGVSAQLEVAKRSQKYDLTLPLGALRSEGTDQFVLVLREVQTVMGAEQTVEKVAVEKLAQDSERMAITSSGLQWDDQVVVSATKPVSGGDRVRLAEADVESM